MAQLRFLIVIGGLGIGCCCCLYGYMSLQQRFERRKDVLDELQHVGDAEGAYDVDTKPSNAGIYGEQHNGNATGWQAVTYHDSPELHYAATTLGEVDETPEAALGLIMTKASALPAPTARNASVKWPLRSPEPAEAAAWRDESSRRRNELSQKLREESARRREAMRTQKSLEKPPPNHEASQGVPGCCGDHSDCGQRPGATPPTVRRSVANDASQQVRV